MPRASKLDLSTLANRTSWHQIDTLRVTNHDMTRSGNPRRRLVASVRYIVADIDKAVEFYRDNLDFKVEMHNPGKFAALLGDELTLYLSAPGAGSGGQAGGVPKPGGWNRFMVVTRELDALIDR